MYLFMQLYFNLIKCNFVLFYYYYYYYYYFIISGAFEIHCACVKSARSAVINGLEQWCKQLLCCIDSPSIFPLQNNFKLVVLADTNVALFMYNCYAQFMLNCCWFDVVIHKCVTEKLKLSYFTLPLVLI